LRIGRESGLKGYLLHVYKKGSRPFQSLSALPLQQALEIMTRLYVEGSVFWERFKDPVGYLTFRKQIEMKLRNGFIEKGGRPKSEYPIYLVLGRPKWFDLVADTRTLETTDEIRVPLSILENERVSFTYPDSMVSALMELEKNPEYYEPDYHGKVFTMNEIEEIIGEKGLPGEGWETRMPRHYAHYIEAQVWDPQSLLNYFEHVG
jgi:hypothetical protein